MSSKRTVVVAVLWAVLLGPAACLAGVLGHACPSCPESSCGHEIGCASDPCTTLLVPVSSPRSDDDGARHAPSSPGLPEWQESGLAAPAASLLASPCHSLRLRLPPAGSSPPLRC